MGLCAVGPRVKDGSSASSTGTPLLDSYNPLPQYGPQGVGVRGY